MCFMEGSVDGPSDWLWVRNLREAETSRWSLPRLREESVYFAMVAAERPEFAPVGFGQLTFTRLKFPWSMKGVFQRNIPSHGFTWHFVETGEKLQEGALLSLQLITAHEEWYSHSCKQRTSFEGSQMNFRVDISQNHRSICGPQWVSRFLLRCLIFFLLSMYNFEIAAAIDIGYAGVSSWNFFFQVLSCL